MEQINFNDPLIEYIFLELWLNQQFEKDQEYFIKKARYAELDKMHGWKKKDLGYLRKKLGNAKYGALSHLMNEVFKGPKWKLIERELYNRMQGIATENFAETILPPLQHIYQRIMDGEHEVINGALRENVVDVERIKGIFEAYGVKIDEEPKF